MKLHILSDLHLEFYRMDAAAVLGDALILAGDIVTFKHLSALEDVARNYLDEGRPVLFVPGNHEFYEQVQPLALLQLKRYCRSAGITMLHNSVVAVGHVRVFGATLWTDYALHAHLTLRQQMVYAAEQLADHRYVYMPAGKGFRVFTPADALAAHGKSVRLLRQHLHPSFAGKTVVISHHGPHPGSTAGRFRGSPLNGAFMSDLTGVISEVNPALWVHGHVHDSFDYTVATTRIVANPRGYPLRRSAPLGMPMPFENPSFNPELVIEV